MNKMMRRLFAGVFEENPIQPSEIAQITVEFSDRLLASETILGTPAPTVVITKRDGTDVSATILVSASISVVTGAQASSAVRFSVQSMVDGERYNAKVIATVNTTQKKLEADVFIPCLDVKSLV